MFNCDNLCVLCDMCEIDKRYSWQSLTLHFTLSHMHAQISTSMLAWNTQPYMSTCFVLSPPRVYPDIKV
jgi:hypothetical protein